MEGAAAPLEVTAMALSNRSAQKRSTLDIPGVDTREQRDRAAPKLTGPAIRKASFRPQGGGPISTHYVRLDSTSRPLCPMTLHPDPKAEPGQRVCEACRIEAARLRTVLA